MIVARRYLGFSRPVLVRKKLIVAPAMQFIKGNAGEVGSAVLQSLQTANLEDKENRLVSKHLQTSILQKKMDVSSVNLFSISERINRVEWRNRISGFGYRQTNVSDACGRVFCISSLWYSKDADTSDSIWPGYRYKGPNRDRQDPGHHPGYIEQEEFIRFKSRK